MDGLGTYSLFMPILIYFAHLIAEGHTPRKNGFQITSMDATHRKAIAATGHGPCFSPRTSWHRAFAGQLRTLTGKMVRREKGRCLVSDASPLENHTQRSLKAYHAGHELSSLGFLAGEKARWALTPYFGTALRCHGLPRCYFLSFAEKELSECLSLSCSSGSSCHTGRRVTSLLYTCLSIDSVVLASTAARIRCAISVLCVTWSGACAGRPIQRLGPKE